MKNFIIWLIFSGFSLWGIITIIDSPTAEPALDRHQQITMRNGFPTTSAQDDRLLLSPPLTQTRAIHDEVWPTVKEIRTPTVISIPLKTTTRPQLISEATYCPAPNDIFTKIAAQAGIDEDSLRAFNGVGGQTAVTLGKPIRLPLGSTPPDQWMTTPITGNLSYQTQLITGASGYYLGTSNRQMQVSLTFDIGYNPDNIELMHYLADEGVQATFFMVGGHPDMVNTALNQGHELGNHSWTHRDLTALTESEIREEIARTERVIVQETVGTSSRPFFRAPFGTIDERVTRIAHEEGFQLVGWTADSGDWLPDITTEEIVERVTTGVCPGAIVIMHGSRPVNRAALPEIIRFLREQGYDIVPLSTLLRDR